MRLFTTLVRFDAVYHGHFKCNRAEADRAAGALGLRPRPVPDPRLRRHDRLRPDQAALLRVHTDINPTGIVPAGPDLGGWLTPHGREALGGRPFGDGTPPGPPPPDETVPADHTPLGGVRPTPVR